MILILKLEFKAMLQITCRCRRCLILSGYMYCKLGPRVNYNIVKIMISELHILAQWLLLYL